MAPRRTSLAIAIAPILIWLIGGAGTLGLIAGVWGMFEARRIAPHDTAHGGGMLWVAGLTVAAMSVVALSVALLGRWWYRRKLKSIAAT